MAKHANKPTMRKPAKKQNNPRQTVVRAFGDGAAYAQSLAQTQNKKRRFGLLITAFAIVLVAVLIGVFAYHTIVNNRLNSGDSNAESALAIAQDGQPSYTLIKVETPVAETSPASYDTDANKKTYLLMRSDLANSTISYIVLPATLAIDIKNETRPLYAAEQLGGDAELIETINDFCEVEINHIISTTGEGLGDFVAAMGGVDLTLNHPLDDPYAGTTSIDVGSAHFSKDNILTLLRTRNVAGSEETISENLSNLMTAIVQKLAAHSGFDLANAVSDFANKSYSDLSANAIINFVNDMGSKEGLACYAFAISGAQAKSTNTGEDVFSYGLTAANATLQNFRNGVSPDYDEIDINSVNAADVTVEIRNGAQITGAGRSLQTRLEGWGYVVDSVGDAEAGITYDDTLIVYVGSENKNAAEVICKRLGCGRVVNGGDYYSSDSDVIVIIGVDWSVSS